MIADELRSEMKREDRLRLQRKKKLQLQMALKRLQTDKNEAIKPINRLQKALGLAGEGCACVQFCLGAFVFPQVP
jgi:hypothetical protein